MLGEKLDEIRKAHPDLTQADVIEKLKAVRANARERLVNFLTPEQLTKWDAERSRKLKAFYGTKPFRRCAEFLKSSQNGWV